MRNQNIVQSGYESPDKEQSRNYAESGQVGGDGSAALELAGGLALIIAMGKY